MSKFSSFGFASIFGCSHIGITRQYIIIIYWLWRAGAEQKGEEEEGH
jgi:hypothetical protein